MRRKEMHMSIREKLRFGAIMLVVDMLWFRKRESARTKLLPESRVSAQQKVTATLTIDFGVQPSLATQLP